YVDWNALSGDAEGITDIDALVERVKQTTANKNSVVLLMHDAGDKTYTLDALPRIIEYLREEGYEFLNFYDIMSP
ncbi:MAG: polysaccharide deacetylase, partial [Clostridia bacterium]|nr:polysaccharide deacetylase [Clostridia bacterium]